MAILWQYHVSNKHKFFIRNVMIIKKKYKTLKILVDIIAILCIAVMVHCVKLEHNYSMAHPNYDNDILLSKKEQSYMDNIGRALLPFAFSIMWLMWRYYAPIANKYPKLANSKWFIFLPGMMMFFIITWMRFFWN